MKSIALYSLDAYNADGKYGKSGTSRVAMMFLANWFNQFGKTKKFPIEATFLDTSFRRNNRNLVTVKLKEDGSLVAAEVVVLADVKENKEEVKKDAGPPNDG